MPTRSLFRSSAIIAIGVGGGYLALVAAAPVLSRLYSPEDFGALAVFASFLAVLAAAASGGYDQAVPLPAENETADALVQLGMVWALGLAVVSGLLAWIVAPGVAAGFDIAMPASAPALLALGVALVGCQRAVMGWAVRRESHFVLGQARALNGLVHAATQIGCGLIGMGAAGLMLGESVGRGAGAVRLVPAWLRDRTGRRARLRDAMVTYRRYPLVVVPSSLVNAFGLYAPQAGMAWLFGPRESGHFVMALLILGAPVGLASVAFGQVFMGRMAQLAREHPAGCAELFRRGSRWLLGGGLAVVVLVALPAAWLFPWILGDRWAEAGIYAALLAPLVASQLAVSPLAQTVYVVDRLGMQLAWDVGRCSAILLLFVAAGVLDWSPRLVVGLYAVIMAVLYIMLYVLYHHSLKQFIAERQ